IPQAASSSTRHQSARLKAEDAPCPACTLLNPPDAHSCRLCNTPLPPRAAGADVAHLEGVDLRASMMAQERRQLALVNRLHQEYRSLASGKHLECRGSASDKHLEYRGLASDKHLEYRGLTFQK
ncbi:hypothetical protein BOX15_Mlig029058g2, partial [Macrostomum lignano]